jgi:Domain of unknown function (DUF4173)
MKLTELSTEHVQSAAGRRAVALLSLVFAADVLFYGQPVGVSLALFAAMIGVALSWVTGHRNTVSMALLGLACLPVIEDCNPLSVAILTLGVVIFALRAHFGPALSWSHLPLFTVRFAMTALPRTALDMPDALRLVRRNMPQRPTQLRRNWSMPIALGICFAILLTLANPVLQAQVERLLTINLAPGNASRHLAFCLAIAAAVWPFLARPRENLTSAMAPIDPGRLGINETSVSHALILFNALFAIQTILDLTYLWAGITLPDGLTPATYAQRGAYPLLATALLAGAFTLISRPFAKGGLRALLLIWTLQNVLLVISALYRLDLYVAAFGLTYLRIAAAIWMALVAIGLALTAWQILRRHSNGWLLWRCGMLGLGTIYACAFVNFAHVIATVNLQRPYYDTSYLCSLGPNAAAAIRAYERQHATICWRLDTGAEGWRDWGFRTARVTRFLEATP